MKDDMGDKIKVSWESDDDTAYGYPATVYLECSVFDGPGGHVHTSTAMSLSPKKARKLADKLYKAANKAEGLCPKTAANLEKIDTALEGAYGKLAEDMNLLDTAEFNKPKISTGFFSCPCQQVIG